LSPIIKSWRKQTEFVQNASHELRTPLTIIQTKQELLLEEPESKIIDKAEEINISLNETKRLTKLIKDLMTLARADSNDDIIKKEKVKIDELIKEIVIPYVDFATVQQKKFILDLNYNKEINVDRNKIHQLLVILLDNAIKYTEEKDLIEIKTYERENKFILEVKDTGIGINEESITHIFDRFYREDKARTRQTGGTGLGLSIAYFIVNAHGGNIKAMHNGTKGTMIQVKLPK
jgi:two-component system sensor histidine kinase CiaH